MTHEQILNYFNILNTNNKKTVVTFSDKTELIGCFNWNNEVENINSNEWNFILHHSKEEIIINGNEIIKIEFK